MTQIRWGRHRAARHSPPPIVLGVVWSLMLAALWATPSTAADPSPGTGPGTVTLVADGPFGRVEGFASGTDGPTPDPGDLPVLDAWARGATMIVRPTNGTLAPWRAIALSEHGRDLADVIELGSGDGDAVIELPTSGLFLIRVDGTIRPDGDAIEGSWWWHVAVPDRDPPPGETSPPPPAIRLASGDAVTALEQGSGCHLGVCGDIGRVSPPDLLPTIRTIPGAPLSISLADGSGMVRWWVSGTPVDGGDAGAVSLGQAQGTWATQAWVPAPTPGEWVIEASVTFDRQRGHFDGHGRLIVESSPIE